MRFTSAEDPLTKQPINLEYSAVDFELSDLPLFKMAAHEKLRKLTGEDNVQCSIKYQVLSKETAMVGVVKQKKKATGELLEYSIEMGRKLTTEGLIEESQLMQRQQISFMSNSRPQFFKMSNSISSSRGRGGAKMITAPKHSRMAMACASPKMRMSRMDCSDNYEM